jgi:hypothetical protein
MTITAAERSMETTDATEVIAAAAERLAARMTTEYTPMWEVSDFLLDAASALSDDPLAVAEVHELHREFAPTGHRSVVRTTEAAALVKAVRRIAELDGPPEPN